MRTRSLFQFCFLCLTSLFLMSCYTPGCDTAFYQATNTFSASQCGPCIQYTCDRLCDQCQVNQPACKACWSCLNDVGCGAGDASLYNNVRPKSCAMQRTTRCCGATR